jgi:hypothetical protein
MNRKLLLATVAVFLLVLSVSYVSLAASSAQPTLPDRACNQVGLPNGGYLYWYETDKTDIPLAPIGQTDPIYAANGVVVGQHTWLTVKNADPCYNQATMDPSQRHLYAYAVWNKFTFDKP